MSKGYLLIHPVIKSSYPVVEKDIVIKLIDSISGRECVSIQMNLSEFSLAMCGENRECSFSIDTKYIGKKQELKTEVIERPEKLDDETLQNVVLTYETNGWKVRNLEEFKKSHQKKVNITFMRWVDVV